MSNRPPTRVPHAAVPRVARAAPPFARLLTRGTAVAVAAWSVASCADNGPERVAGPRADVAAAALRASVAPAPPANTAVPVQVPASMRSWPFDVGRTLTVPAGYAVSVYARVPSARFMAVAPNGDLLVSTPDAGAVRLVRPGVGGADPRVTDWATGLRRPHDIVFRTIGAQTYAYVSEADKVARYTYAVGDTVGRGRQVVVANLPSASTPELHGAYGHELKNIALAGDALYVSIASTCNVCASDTQSDPVRAAVYRYNVDGTGARLYARGLRNAEGLAFVPGTSTLWVVVNNRDNIGYPKHGDFDGDGQDDYGRVMQAYVDNHPPELFTRVRDGGNYGWPFCNSDPDGPNGVDDMPLLRDVELNANGSQLDCATADRASKGIQAHSAPLGLTFLQSTNAPAAYRTGALVALHGSWNRAVKTGYKVVHFAWDATAGLPGTQTDFVTGWASASDQWGRPVDVAVSPAGGVYVSDDYSGTVYRVTPASGATSNIVGVASGRCLTVANGSQAAGTRAALDDCRRRVEQLWVGPAAGATGPVRVYAAMCLAPKGTSTGNGTAVVIATCDGSVRQQWTRTAAGELRGVGGKCLSLSGGRSTNGTAAILWTCTGVTQQRWDVRL